MLLRDRLNHELIRRHGYGMLHTKLRPVHLANALMRQEHAKIGDMRELKLIMEATAPGSSDEKKSGAVAQLLERSRERWGRLGDAQGDGNAAAMQRVLPLLRAILNSDTAAYGTTPDKSAFSSPTALTATNDISDEHAGEFVFRLWNHDMEGTGRNPILDLWQRLTDPQRKLAEADDLTALLAPLSSKTKDITRKEPQCEDLVERSPSQQERELWRAAALLERYESALQASPIASLQRITVMAALTIYFHVLSRPGDRMGTCRRPVLVDATPSGSSAVARASTRTVHAAQRDAALYTQALLRDLLGAASPGSWVDEPADALVRMMEDHQRERKQATDYGGKKEARHLRERLHGVSGEQEVLSTIVQELEALSGNRTLTSYLRLIGARAGFLYPQQRTTQKRCQPCDRTLEVLVAGTVDMNQRNEYREFLDELHRRWGLIVGGRPEDAALLAEAGAAVPSRELRENSTRFLQRLEAQGLALRLADSVAVVGLQDERRG